MQNVCAKCLEVYMNRIKIVYNNPMGFHARPATMFSKVASEYKSNITVKNGDKETDSKNIIGLLTLNINPGDEMEIIADGSDEEAALKALKNLIENDFDE
jgi:phosphocarrier protein HPr